MTSAGDTAVIAARRVPSRLGRVGPFWPRVAAALGGGLLLYAAFPPLGWWPLAPAAIAVITLALRGCTPWRAAWLAALFAVTFFWLLFEWMRVVGVDAWIALAAFQALYFAPLGAALALVNRLPGWPVWSACLWVAEELVRDRVPLGGFPWGRLAGSQAASPFTGYAAIGGAPLVTFVTALTGALVAAAVTGVLTGSVRRRVVAFSTCAALGLPLLGVVIPTGGEGKMTTVAVVQGNVPRLGLDFLGQRRAVLNNHVQRTHELAAAVAAGRLPRPDLVVWPENSSDIDPYHDPTARHAIDGAVRAAGVPVLVGVVIGRPDGRVENRGHVWDPRSGPGEYYVKRHPVPFGEYVPFRALLTKYISRFERVPADFVAGRKPGVLRLGPTTIGDVICFEIAYDEIVRDVARGGAQVLVVQTNNATYGGTGQPSQQLALSRLRAVEHGRPVLVAATSGISAIVAPDGRLHRVAAEFTPDVLVGSVPARTTATVATRLGAKPEWSLALLGILAVGLATVRATRAGGVRDDG